MRQIYVLIPLLFLVFYGVAGAQERSDRSLEERVAALESSQEGLAGHDFHVTGYANWQYVAPEEGKSNFNMLFAPIFLFKAGEMVLFEAELEFSLEAEETEVTFEYAQIDYMFGDNAILTAGKFLLPLGIFGERLHPSWINKLPTAPIIYAGHGGTEAGIVPVLSDFGVQLRGGFAIGDVRWTYAVFLVNGPRANESDSSEEGHGGGHAASVGTVNYAPSSSDDNNNKAYGLRFGILPAKGMEFGLSYYSGDVSYEKFVDETSGPGEDAEEPIILTMVDFTWQMGAFQLQGEYLIEDSSAIDEYVTSHTMDDADTPGDETATTEQHIPGQRAGYWIQASHMFGGMIPEIVLRYGASTSDGEDVGVQTALGVNWWMDTSLVLKTAAVSNTITEEDHDTGESESETTTDYYIALALGF